MFRLHEFLRHNLDKSCYERLIAWTADIAVKVANMAGLYFRKH